jgi:hypothetical protein
METQKIFAELGRMHLEIMQLHEQLAALQMELAKYKESEANKPEQKS